MRIARGTAWALTLMVAMAAFAPAWAQDSQQTPPTVSAAQPSGPETIGRMRVYRSGPGGGTRVMVRQVRGMAVPWSMPCASPLQFRDRVWARGRTGMGPGGNMFSWRFRDTGGAPGMGSGAGFGRGAGLDRIVNNPNLRRQLGIADAQAAKIRQQTTDFQVSQIRSRADLQVDELQLRNLLAAQNPDRTAIDQKLDQIGAAQIAQRKQQVDYMLAMRDALTPEQRQKLKQMREAPVGRSWRGHTAAPARPAPPGRPNP